MLPEETEPRVSYGAKEAASCDPGQGQNPGTYITPIYFNYQ